jgi:hypothetical protein
MQLRDASGQEKRHVRDEIRILGMMPHRRSYLSRTIVIRLSCLKKDKINPPQPPPKKEKEKEKARE